MLRVYVAGAYSADNVINVLGNMRRGIKLSVEVLKHGMAPFCPWLDFQFGLHREFSLQTFYDYSIAWLKAADAMIVVPEGYVASIGTQRERWVAMEMGIPEFFSIERLLDWKKQHPEQKHPKAVREPGREGVLVDQPRVGYDDLVEDQLGDVPDFDAPSRAAYEPCGFDEGLEGDDLERLTAEALVDYAAPGLRDAKSVGFEEHTRDTGFKSILKEMAELHDRKEKDYGTEGDPLANIRGSEEFGVPAWISCEVRLNDKQRRIHNFIRKGELVNEPVEDSLLDRAVYSVIALQLYREQKEKEK